MNVKSDWESRKHHYTTKLITIPYVPNGNSRDQVGAWGESRMPEGKGNKHPKNQRHHRHHPMHQEVDALGALLQSWNTFLEHQKWPFLERLVGGGNAEEEVVEVVDEGSVGLSLREHAISRSWCYTYLNCFKTNITERTVRWFTKAQQRN